MTDLTPTPEGRQGNGADSHAPDCNCHICQPYSEWLESAGATVQGALNRVGRRLNVHDVRALEELDAAFRAWVEKRRGTIHWDYETRLIRAIADVIHVELVEEDE